MIDRVKKIHSHDSGPFWQFVKYGAIGVMATLVQTGVFCILATTCRKRLGADDVMAIAFFWQMATLAVIIEVVEPFPVNFSVRKFFIFKG